MPVMVDRLRWPPAILNRRNGAIAALAGVAAIVSTTIVVDPRLSKAVGDRVAQSVHRFETVAAMLSERSPGQRPKGALANLKHEKAPVEANAATPQAHVIPPLQAIMATPAIPLIIPPPIAAPPLYNVVAGAPAAPIVPASSAAGGGPPILTGIPLPGGGIGGGVVVPPPIVTQVVPPPPVTSAVPEPASWAMMLAGFAMLGGALRRQKRNRPLPAIG